MNSAKQQGQTDKPVEVKEYAPRLRHPGRLWLLALVLGVAFDFLFWGHPAGLNVALFLTLCLCAGGAFLVSEGYRPARSSLWLLIPFAFFAGATFLRQEPLTSFLAYSFTLVLLGFFVSSFIGGRWFLYGLRDYFGKFFDLIGSLFARAAYHLHRSRQERKARAEPAGPFPVGAVLRGLFLALPILMLFTALLSSGDAIFGRQVSDFLSIFNAGKVLEYIWRLMTVLLCAWGLAGAFLHAASRSADTTLAADRGIPTKRAFGFTETSIILGSISILFLLFIIVQFRYFFGGQSNIGATGFTYSEYARRGFNELIWVAFLSLLLVMGLGTITGRGMPLQKRIFSWLSVAILVQVLVILLAAFQRLELAIDWHGFSRLRLYPRVFLIWIGILFAAIVVLELLHYEQRFALAFVLASLGFATSLTLVNVDAAIAKRNILRISQGKTLNVGHLASLSTDAIPALVAAYRDLSLPASTRVSLGAVLVCYSTLNPELLDEPTDWRSYNYSRWKAHGLLSGLQPELAGYRVNEETWNPRVRTPANVVYECGGVY